MAAIVRWFDEAARDLPWRTKPDPWAVMVSEVMLQQTPVNRVLPVFESWMARWSTPSALAVDPPGEAIRMWGRLGYPRRALRLHAAATACLERFEGKVPSDVADLRSLPGIGEYTAAAVAAFAFGQRHAVLDTNVRRVHGRWLDGSEHPLTAALRSSERTRALQLLPTDPKDAAKASVSVMELGALVCTSRTPQCSACPITAHCAWRAAGYPRWDGPPRRGQKWGGTDRQCRGSLMAVLRDSREPVPYASLAHSWTESEQRDRALASLVADGLVVKEGDGYRLP
jgi:A/G-specific adenine glycosylase